MQPVLKDNCRVMVEDEEERRTPQICDINKHNKPTETNELTVHGKVTTLVSLSSDPLSPSHPPPAPLSVGLRKTCFKDGTRAKKNPVRVGLDP